MIISFKEMVRIYNSYIANGIQKNLLPIIIVTISNGKILKGRLMFADNKEIAIVGEPSINFDNILELKLI